MSEDRTAPELSTRALKTLESLGISQENRRVLKLLPLIYVAWADGKMERVEIERILDVANNRFYIGRSGEAVLERWLKTPPTPDQIAGGLLGLLELARHGDEAHIDESELHEVMVHAESVARATEHAFDAATAVTAEEEEALAHIAELLEVDAGVTWRQIWDEVKSVRAPATTDV